MHASEIKHTQHISRVRVILMPDGLKEDPKPTVGCRFSDFVFYCTNMLLVNLVIPLLNFSGNKIKACIKVSVECL